MQNRVISVTALSNYIKSIFDAEMLLNNINVVGEISGWSYSGNNVFFTLKDSSAILNCVLFGGTEQKYKTGDKVIVTGTPKYYAKAGKLNFNVVKIELFGEGDIYKRFLELKNKLEREGLFDPLHKLPLPKKIDRIGVITSETGAVIHDIINVATRRNAGQDIVLYPIKVQGIGADIEIARGINFFSNYQGVDAIIVGRGGGSEEDLQNFNSEVVARAIYDCKKFVVSAVGHETDNTICDLVADLRAPTPSAAAELLTKDGAQRKRELELMWANVEGCIMGSYHLRQNNLDNLRLRLMSKLSNFAEVKTQSQLALKDKIAKLNPKVLLNKGYAKIEKNGESVTSVGQLAKNEQISIFLSDGKIKAEVNEVEKWITNKN
ncbi:MAG: exodeoxyribonuclease VII large subunit [Christensenellales bacterium]